MKNRIFCGILAFFAASCSGIGGDNNPTTALDSPRFPDVTLKCDESGPCAPQIAALYNPYYPGGSVCTASLVAEQNGRSIMQTNKHCIQGADNGCGGLIFDFPEQEKFPRVGARCSSLVSISPDTLDKNMTGRDYAYVLLDRKISRPSFDIRPRGINDGEMLTVDYLDTSNGPDLVVRETQCRSVMKSFVNRQYTHPNDRILTLFGCKLYKGTSGAPVRDVDGNLVALLYEGTDLEVVKKETSDGGDSAWLVKPLLQNAHLFNYVLRLGCVDAPAVGLSVDDPENCSEPETLRPKTNPEDTKKNLAKILANINDQFAMWDRQDTQQIFDFTPDTRPKTFLPIGETQKLVGAFGITPKCFHAPTDKWLSTFKVPAWMGLSEDFNTNATARFNQPVFYIYLKMDELLRMTTELGRKDVETNYQFDARAVSKGQKTTVTVTSEGKSSTLELSPCPIQNE